MRTLYIKNKTLMLLILTTTFFLSGASALMYQISWQRLLFASIGIDIDSVTIIVSVFMLGLGIGGLIGGRVSDKFNNHLITIYVVSELLIGIFGALSPLLIKYSSSHFFLFLASSHSLNALGCFLILLLPTICMGMTLPILTIALNLNNKNIGSSVGMLYFANTLGAALGAALVPFILFNIFTIYQVIWIAAFSNMSVAIFAFLGNSLLRVNNA